MLFAKVTGYIKDKFAGGNRTVSVSKVKGLGNDSQVLHCFAPGVEINPADNSNLAIQMVGGFSVAVGGVNQDIEPDTERGEKRFFSTDDTGKGIKAIVKFKADGTLELNGATDSAVLYSKMLAEFNKLNAKYDDLVSKYNAHIHITTATIGATTVPGIISPTVSSGTPSDADMTQAESVDVRLS